MFGPHLIRRFLVEFARVLAGAALGLFLLFALLHALFLVTSPATGGPTP